jgi:micrococcal nuclease
MKSIVLLLLAIMFTQVTFAETIEGKVIRVTDGDTITILREKTQYKIRFAGIDAPESSQAYGNKSKLALGDYLKGKAVRVETTEKDRYGRNIGFVYANNSNVNNWMVQNGWAWHYKQYSKDQKLSTLEIAARKQKLGLWADSSNPIAPWEYRSLKRHQTAVKKGAADC